MPHSVSVTPGSGTVPSLLPYLPGGHKYNQPITEGLTYLDAEPTAIMNPEDLSAFRGGGDTQIVALSAGAAARLDKGVGDRRAVAIINTHETATLYIGFRDTITTTPGALGGWPVLPQTAISIDCTNRYKIWGISTVDIVVGVMEIC